MNRPFIRSNDYTGTSCILVHADSGEPVRKGDSCTDFRNDTSMIMSGVAPHKPGSNGYVHTESGQRLYAGVFDLKWTIE